MAFQYPYPKNLAIDFDTDWVSSMWDQSENQHEAVAQLVHNMKAQVTVFIDPSGDGDYETIQEAFDDGKSFLVLKPGVDHVGDVTPPQTRSYYIAPFGDQSLIGSDWNWWTGWPGADYRESTKITGNILLPSAQIEPLRRSFVLSNVDIRGDFRGQDNWNARFFKCGLSGEMWQDNDVTATLDGKGCQFTFDKCFSVVNPATSDTVRWRQTGVYLDMGMGANIYMRGCDFSWFGNHLVMMTKPVFELAVDDSYLDVRDTKFFFWLPNPSPDTLKFIEVPYPIDNPQIGMFFKNVLVEFNVGPVGGVHLLDGSGGEQIIGSNFQVNYENVLPPFRLEGGGFTSYDHKGIDFFGGPIYPPNTTGSAIYPVFSDMDYAGGTGWLNVPGEGNDLSRTSYPAGRWTIQSAMGGVHLVMGNLFCAPVAVNFGAGGATFPLGQVLGDDDILVGLALRPSDPVTYSAGVVNVGIGIPLDVDKHLLTPMLFATSEHVETLFDHNLLGAVDDFWISTCDAVGAPIGQFDGGEMMVLIFFLRRVGMYL